jgi:hypothetical protein
MIDKQPFMSNASHLFMCCQPNTQALHDKK